MIVAALCSTPFGFWVEPEVAITTAISSDSKGAERSLGRVAWSSWLTYSFDVVALTVGIGAMAGPVPASAARRGSMSAAKPSGPGGTGIRASGRSGIA